MKKKINNILFAIQDLGGFNALFPVIKQMRRNRMPHYVLLAKVSRDAAQKHDLQYIDGTDLSTQELKNILIKKNITVVITGTSFGLGIDKKLVLIAREMKIQSISIVDFWVNYKLRFSNPHTGDLAYLPDYICIIDEKMKKQMIDIGFNKKSLYMTGNPFFESFDVRPVTYKNIFVFVAQGRPTDYSTPEKTSEEFIHYDNDVGLLQDYIRALQQLRMTYPIYLCLHPRLKNKEAFKKLLKNSKLNISIDDRDTILLVQRALLVIGINSVLLFQAALMGKRVVSYQPGLSRKDDPLISNQLGLSLPAYNRDELLQQLKHALVQPVSKDLVEIACKKYVYSNPTDQVIALINNAT